MESAFLRSQVGLELQLLLLHCKSFSILWIFWLEFFSITNKGQSCLFVFCSSVRMVDWSALSACRLNCRDLVRWFVLYKLSCSTHFRAHQYQWFWNVLETLHWSFFIRWITAAASYKRRRSAGTAFASNFKQAVYIVFILLTWIIVRIYLQCHVIRFWLEISASIL